MKKISVTKIVLFSLLIVASVFMSCDNVSKPKNVSLKTYADSLSYTIGYLYGLDIADVPFDFNLKMLFQGFANAADPSLEVLTEDEIIGVLERFSDVMASYYEEMENQHMREHDEMFVFNSDEGKNFMEENAKNPEFTTTESGLQYRVVKAGNGRRPRADSTVLAHYTSKFLNGDVFDSSYIFGEPVTIELSSTIEGWNEALLLMREGDVFEVVLPYFLAYGERGFDIIEPGMTLIFDLELIEVVQN